MLERNRYLVGADEIADSYQIAADQGFVLMGQREPDRPIPVMVFIMPEEHLAPDFPSQRYAVCLNVVRHDAEALEWFEEMMRTQPWKARH